MESNLAADTIASKLALFEARIATNDESTSGSFIANIGKKGKNSEPHRRKSSSLPVPVHVDSFDTVEMSEVTETEGGDDCTEFASKDRSRLLPEHSDLATRRQSHTRILFAVDDDDSEEESDACYHNGSSTFMSDLSGAVSRQNTVKSIAQQFEARKVKEDPGINLVQPTRQTSVLLQSTIKAFESEHPVKHTEDYEKYKEELAEISPGLLDQNVKAFIDQSEAVREMNTRSKIERKYRRKSDSSSARAFILTERTEADSLTSSDEDDHSFTSHSSFEDDVSANDSDTNENNERPYRPVNSLRPGMERGHSIDQASDEMQAMQAAATANNERDTDESERRPPRRVNALRPGVERGHNVENFSNEMQVRQSGSAADTDRDFDESNDRPRRQVNALRPGVERGLSLENLAEQLLAMHSSPTALAEDEVDANVERPRRRVNALRPGMERGLSLENLAEQLGAMHSSATALGEDEADASDERPRRRVSALRPGVQRGNSIENVLGEMLAMHSSATALNENETDANDERPRRRVNALRPGVERGHSIENLLGEMLAMHSSATTLNENETDANDERPRRRVNALRPGVERGHSIENQLGEMLAMQAVASTAANDTTSACSSSSDVSKDFPIKEIAFKRRSRRRKRKH